MVSKENTELNIDLNKNLILTCTALSAKVYKEGELFFWGKFTGELAEENSELKVANKSSLYKYNIKVLEEDNRR